MTAPGTLGFDWIAYEMTVTKRPQGTRDDGGAAYYGPGRSDAPRPAQAPSPQVLPGGSPEQSPFVGRRFEGFAGGRGV